MRYKIIYLLVILLAIQLVIAQEVQESSFDAQKGYEWLLKQSRKGSYGDIITTSIAALAYNNVNAIDQAEGAVRALQKDEGDLFCWPKSTCRIKESGLAVVALDNINKEIDNELKWLVDAQSAGFSTGWYLEIVSGSNGTCSVSYMKNDNEVSKDVKADGKWIDLNKDIELNLIKNYPGIELEIDCSSLGGNVVIAVIYNSGNSYYLVENENSPIARLNVNNGCFGVTSKTGCDYESSLYANWALKNAVSGINSETYLREKYSLTTINSALLFYITEDEQYANNLILKQQKSGSWDNNIYNTALSVVALNIDSSKYSDSLSNGVEWLKSKQQADGGFGSVLDSAMALYAISIYEASSVSLAECNDLEQNGDEEGVDCGGSCPISCTEVPFECGDEVCDSELGEDSDNCPQDCYGVKREKCEQEGDSCRTNDGCSGTCDEFLDCVKYDLNCPEDECGDGICDEYVGEDEITCPVDCGAESVCGNSVTEGSEECEFSSDCSENEVCESCFCVREEDEGGFPWWLLFLFIIIILVGAIIFYLRRGKKPGPRIIRRDREEKKNIFVNVINKFKKPEKEERGIPEYRPFTSRLNRQEEVRPKFTMPYPTTRPSSINRKKKEKSKVEEELEKSLEEAKKLLKKK